MRREEAVTLLCYAEGSDKTWEGICLDFDLAVQGTSAQDVIAKLDDAIRDYLEYVHSLPEEEQKKFLSRRVPWRLTLGVVLKMLFAWVCHRRDTKGRYSYSVPCSI